ncbi:histone H2A-like [Topomyia yanbarensis]|uniref:histone H2A-like n=1 Tax=Topomyia yanbarensis TaxID=2498891 RepID=UPI00273C5252|nr:histone H2A-like [Topomyia yanbarensis]
MEVCYFAGPFGFERKLNQVQNWSGFMRVRHHPCVTLLLATPVSPTGRIHRLWRKSHYAERVDAGAPACQAAVMKYLAQKLVIRNDEELNKLLSGVTISQGGVLLNIKPILLPKKTEKKSKESATTGEKKKNA